MNVLRSIVEGLGSKTLSAIFIGIVSTFMLPIVNAKLGLGISPDQLVYYIGLVVGPLVLYVFKQWHLDIATGGKTTTQALMVQKMAQVVADIAPDNTVVDKLAKAIMAAIQNQDSSGEPVAPVAVVPPPAPGK